MKTGLDDYLYEHTIDEFLALPQHEIKPGEEVVVTGSGKSGTPKSKRNHLHSARILIDEHKLIQTRREGRYFYYQDGYYQELYEGDIVSLMYSAYGDLPLTSIASIFKAIKSITSKPIWLFNQPRYLNLSNGLFDLDTYTLQEHTPDVYSTIRLDVTYDGNSKCPKWEKAIQDIIEDEENIRALQEFFGLCLTTETYDRALILTGEGSNGKSTLLDVLSGVLGAESCSQIPMSLLEDRNFVAQLQGKLLNVASEIGSKNTVCDEILKQIITHDEITGAHKYGHPFKFRPTCKLIFATNNLPRTDDKSKALYRRLMIMNLTKEFTENDAKHKYHRELLEERNGIFNWMVCGLKRLRERGKFALGKKMVSAVQEYKRENNPIISFFEEECVVEQGESISNKKLYTAYQDYCKDSGFHACSINKFGREVKRCLNDTVLSGRLSHGTMRIWRGIRLIMPGENQPGERPF